MDFGQALDLLMKHRDHIYTLWSHYMVIIGAIVGWLISVRHRPLNLVQKWLGSLAFIGFIALNLPALLQSYDALDHAARQLNALGKAMTLEPGLAQWIRENPFTTIFGLSRWKFTLTTHLVLDLMVLTALWYEPMWTHASARMATPSAVRQSRETSTTVGPTAPTA